MILSFSAQMREADRYAIENLGIESTVLMQNAAEHVANAAMEHLPPGKCAAVVCGTGNNGGDGIGAAAYLLRKGVPVRVFLVGNTKKITADSKEMLSRYSSLGGVTEAFCLSETILAYLEQCAVIIDAMFGIGLNSDLSGDARLAAEMINHSNALVISADIPSGVNADTGAVLGYAVNADITVTFTRAKPGHFIEPGCACCGQLRVRDIGIPDSAIDITDCGVYAVFAENVFLPARNPVTHKGDYGRCLIAAGSVGYTGAPALSARAASRMGAGLVYLGVPEPVYEIMAHKLDEEMPFPLPSDSKGRLAATAAGELIRRASHCDSLLIGPGLGQSDEITELVNSALQLSKTPIVLDADGINAISGNISAIRSASCPLILTPHPGEFLRLNKDFSSKDRLAAARAFAREHGCILVLKGHRTITAMPDGTAYINTTGGPALAKAGSGDVLAGMIAALVGQRLPIKDAVLTAVFLHGLAGDMCAELLSDYSVTASDVISMLPKAILSGASR